MAVQEAHLQAEPGLQTVHAAWTAVTCAERETADRRLGHRTLLTRRARRLSAIRIRARDRGGFAMSHRTHTGNLRRSLPLVALGAALVGMASQGIPAAGPANATGDATFAKDIAPILQRSCQRCHRPDSIAPMSLITYEQVRPYASA